MNDVYLEITEDVAHMQRSEESFVECLHLPLCGFWGLNSGCKAHMGSTFTH